VDTFWTWGRYPAAPPKEVAMTLSQTQGPRVATSFDGAEIGSTGVKMTWSLPDGLVSANKLNANNNFAPTAYALAA
jgi:hypothetical protein